MNAVKLFTALALALIVPSATVAAEETLSGKLTLTGSSTVAPLISEIAKRFESRHAGVRVDVQTGGSSRGIADATKGLADIGMSSRALKETEKTNVVAHTLARDGIAMLAHASNPVKNLDDAQILAIYTGKIKNWMEVGGPDAAITVVNRADGRAEIEQFAEYFKIKTPDMVATLVSGENQHGIKTVAGDPNALIYMSVGASERAVANKEAVKILTWNGIEASSATVASGKLPMNRPLILVSRPETTPLAKAFIAFATSAEVHDLVTELSYVPVQ